MCGDMPGRCSIMTSLVLQGISQQEREYFELSNDDERQCLICKTCCFLSAIRCPCSPNRLVCPFHVDDLCACPMNRKVLRYRYTLEELGGMLRALQERSCAYQDWLQQVETLLDGRYQDKPGAEGGRRCIVQRVETVGWITGWVDSQRDGRQRVERTGDM